MQLKLKRTQRSAGIMGGKVIFGLDARTDLSKEEQALVQKYALGKMVVYDSEARKKHQESAYGHFGDATGGGYDMSSAGKSLWKNARGIASAAMMALSLRVTVDSLVSGQHIECKDLNELLGAEGAILDACKSLKAYLDTAVTFDGREEVVEFSVSLPIDHPPHLHRFCGASPTRRRVIFPRPSRCTRKSGAPTRHRYGRRRM